MSSSEAPLPPKVSVPEPELQPAEAAQSVSGRLHPASLLLAVLQGMRMAFFPLLLGLFFVKGEGMGRTILLGWMGILGLQIVASCAHILSLRYGIHEGRLVIASGIFSREVRTLPLERIQNVNSEAGPLQRALGVVDLKVESAGSMQSEVNFSVLAREVAESLRETLLKSKRLARGADPSAPEPVLPRFARPSSTTEIVLAGATTSRVGLIVAAVAGGYELISTLGFSDDAHLAVQGAAGLFGGALATALLAMGTVLLLGWMGSIIFTLVTYHGFVVERVGDEMSRSHGLLSRFATNLPLARLQVLRFDANPIRRWLGYRRVRAETAGSVQDQESGASSTLCPLLPIAESEPFTRLLFPRLALSAIPLEKVHPRARTRGFFRALIATSIPILATAFFWRWEALYALGLTLPGTLVWSILRYRVLGWAIAGGFVIVRAGVWNQRVWIVPERKVQAATIIRGPIQRLFGLASVGVATAGAGLAGRVAVPDLSLARAEALFERLSRRAASGSGV